MKKLILSALLITSSNTYAHAIDTNIIELYEPDRATAQQYGYITPEKQKNMERYQMEVRQLKKEEQERQEKKPTDDGLSWRVYQDKINMLSDEIMTRKSQYN